MAARPGEDVAATLFADLHYYYGPPTADPPHHRFNKGSYVYLFENPSQRRARIEVANRAGTPEQDAFSGYLDGAHLHYSYKHTCLVTLTVDGRPGQSFGGPPADSSEWHLPTFDPRNENKYMYKLHTIDIYFWAKEDAIQFVNSVRRVLPLQQIIVLDEPVAPQSHRGEMSPVVQQLENIAITDPSYQQGRTRDSRTTTTSFPGPPTSATPHSQEASNFAPLAYNPAAPAAPEVIQHREKTPPPLDGASNPLVAAAASDQGQAYGHTYPGSFAPPPAQPPVQTSYFPGPSHSYSSPSNSAQPQSFSGPPVSVHNPAPLPSNMPPPPPSAPLQSPYAQHFQNTFAPPPTANSNSPYASPPPNPSSYQQQQQQQQPQQPAQTPTSQYANYPGSPGLPSPGIYSPGFQQAPQAAQAQPNPGVYTPGPPPGGYAQFNYGNNQQQHVSGTKPLMSDYSIHQQVYRPTEAEASYKPKPVRQPTGKLEQRAGQLEKGVGNLFKKLEKKIG